MGHSSLQISINNNNNKKTGSDKIIPPSGFHEHGKKNVHKLTVKGFRGASNNRHEIESSRDGYYNQDGCRVSGPTNNSHERKRVRGTVITISTVVVYHPPGLSEESSFSGLSMSTEAG
jgi:hypothetical protein